MKIPNDPAIALLGIYPRRENLYLHKNLYFMVHNYFIHNSLKLETTDALQQVT